MPYKIRKNLSDAERASLGGFSDIVAHLLFHRGITDTESAQKFVAPDYEKDTHDPFLLKDAEKAAIRIVEAIKAKERIAIYADYDADGIPGAAVFDDFFKRIGYGNYSIYIPHRHDEGFGLNIEAVEQLAGEGVKLLITIDCGVTDTLQVERANQLGIGVIITDHHEPPTPLPKAFAIVDHKQKDCDYPDKNLCGSGVAFKLIQAILKIDRFGLKEGNEKWLLDLVGIATLSDMVSLTGENRVFARFGLTVLRKSPRKGLMQLLKKLNINQRYLSEDDIAFMITPRINAASRMGKPMDAFKLLSADNDDDAHLFADHLDKINNERKGAVAALVKEVKKTLKERYSESIPKVIVLGNPEWRPSLLGLVANTCAEEFKRPAFFWGRDGDDVIKGSCRSEGKSNVVELMRAAVAETFSQFGGHHHSGGFAVANDEIHFLEKRLNEAADTLENRKTKDSSVSGAGSDSNGMNSESGDASDSDSDFIDMEISLDEVGSNFHGELDKLSPFGVGNPKPAFLFRNVVPVEIRIFGKANDHVELVFRKARGEKISAIAFFAAASDWAEKISANKKIDLVASVEKSMFRGRSEIRLRVIDVNLIG